MLENCPLCNIAAVCRTAQEPRCIYEFPYSYLLLGQHQFYFGYSVLVAKQHARELHQLPNSIHQALWQELMQAATAIYQLFQPWKMNYASYGNQVEHIHWHIFPRYADEPTRGHCPFVNANKFADYPTHSKDLHIQKTIQDLRNLLRQSDGKTAYGN